MKQNEALMKPFFVRFLQAQSRIDEPVEHGFPWPFPGGGSAPGKDKETMKYPSDNDEDIYI